MSRSGTWKAIVKATDYVNVAGLGLYQLVKGVCGNGKELKFWLDTWIGNVPLKSAFLLLFKLEKDKKCSVVDRYDLDSDSFSSCWNWSKSLRSTNELNEERNLLSLLANSHLSAVDDRWIWQGRHGTTMSVKEVKDFITSADDFSDRYVLSWSKWVPSKVNIFVWRMAMDRIPTMEALSMRNCNFGDGLCVLCGQYPESVDHLLCGCEVANMVWNYISIWCKACPFFVFTIKDLLEIHEHVGIGKKDRKALKGIVMVACWCIWKARNDCLFSNSNLRIDNIIQSIK